MSATADNLPGLPRMGEVGDSLDQIDHDLLDLRLARRAPAYLSHLARRLRVIEPGRLADMLDDAAGSGQITEIERQKVLAADLVLSGRSREDQLELYLLAEVSAGVGNSDAARAAERATILRKLDRPVLPVVSGYWINLEAEAQAKDLGVFTVLVERKSRPEEV